MSDDNLHDQLAALNMTLEDNFGAVIDLNADIINATRKMAHSLITIRNGHLAQAETLLELIQGLAASASITAELSADTISAEWGIAVMSEEEFDELEDEDDDEE